MAVNKVVYGTTVLVDLTEDTVTPDKLLKGATAHDASGEPITGTLEAGSGGSSDNNCEAYHITSASAKLNFKTTGTVKVWGYGTATSGYTTSVYAFVGDGYYDSPLCRLLSAETQRGLSLIPDFLVDKFYQEGRVIHATGTPIILPNGSYLSDQYAGWIQYEGDVWLSVECGGEPYSHQDRTVIHEIGHYLGHRTALLDRNTVPEEREWLIRRYRKYCNENNHEFFADSFVAYILWPEELAANAPTVYQHIGRCLHEMKSDLEETNHE